MSEGEETNILCPYCKAKNRPPSNLYKLSDDTMGLKLWCTSCNNTVTRDNLRSLLLKGSGVALGAKVILSFFGINNIDDL